MSFWSGLSVLVTGGAGFIGSHLVEALLERGARVRVVDNFERGRPEHLSGCLGEIELVEGDLRDFALCRKACRGTQVAMHLAAKVGGVAFNAAHPGEMFFKNVSINTNLLEAARQSGCERFLCVSSACVYPRHCRIPTPESEGFRDEPEPTNYGYGWSKRIAEIQARCYHEEYGLPISIVRPYNAYGPRDDFDLETAHVIPALIRKACEGQDPLYVWGDGRQTRAFVYVTDIVEGMLLAIEKFPSAEPLNIGTDEEITIRELVELILGAVGVRPKVVFDTGKPAGQPRRNADISRARSTLGYAPKVKLAEGIADTVAWYRSAVK